jgi:hypothetical protein
MRKIVVSLVCVTLFATLGVGTSFGAAKGTDRPFHASGSGTGVITGDRYVIDGTSEGSLLGNSTFHTEGTLGGGNTITITAANGDQLIITTSPSGDENFRGGTGRFADATGTLTTTFTTSPAPGGFVINFTQEGTISY